MKKVLYILLVLSLSVEFASCSSSDDDPYLNIENESIIITHDDTGGKIKIKTNQKWIVINNSDWVDIRFISGEGSSSITFYCWRNELYKDRKATITIKTASFSKEISITQTGNLKFRPSTFAKLKSSNVFANCYHYGRYAGSHSGYLNQYWTGSIPELCYVENRDKKPVLEIYLSIEAQILSYGWITIFLNDASENMTIKEAKESFLKPYYVDYGSNPYSGKITKPNVTNDNLITSKSDNIITYKFNKFRTVNSEAWSYVLDGEMEFELIN